MFPRSPFHLFFSLLLFAHSQRPTQAMHVGPGQLTSTNDFEFVTKFVFSSNPDFSVPIGHLKGTVQSEKSAYLVVYDDEYFSWSHIHHNASLSCKWALTEYKNGGPAKIKWHLPAGEKTTIELTIRQHLRPRIWYFALIADECTGTDNPGSTNTMPQNNRRRNNHLVVPPIPKDSAAAATTSLSPAVPSRTVDLSSTHFVAGLETNGKPSNGEGAPPKGLGSIHIDILFLNIEQGWQQQFGFDEYGVLPGTVLLLFTYVLLLVYQLCTNKQRTKNVIEAGIASSVRRHHGSVVKYTNHNTSSSGSNSNNSRNSSSNNNHQNAPPLVRIWSILVVLQIVALLLRTVDLIAYASKGSTATRWHWGKVLTVEIFSHALDLMCRLVLTMAVFLVARGWTITSGPGEVRDKHNILLMFGITCFVEVSGHIVISLTYDPSTTLYGYSSYSGMIVVVWRFVQLIWFMKNITTTYFSERDHYRKRLYLWFGFIFSIWFLSLPGVVLTVSHLVAPHWRYKIVRGTIDVIHLLALTSYGVLFWPAWSSHIFEIRGSPRSIEEQNLLLGVVEINRRGSPGWSFDPQSPFYQYEKASGGRRDYDDGL